MSLYWRLASIPELSHLTARERREVLRAGLPTTTRTWLVARPLVMGFFAGLLAALSLDLLVFLPTWLLAATAVHLIQIRKIRRQLRDHIRETFHGRRTPFCLGCGFDLRGAGASECPECGRSTVVNAET